MATALLGSGLTASAQATWETRSRPCARRPTLRAEIAADSKRIGTTTGGLHAAESPAAGPGEAQRARRQLRTVQTLVNARDRLVTWRTACTWRPALAANLVAGYEGSQPSLMTVILNSHGFGDLLDQMSFMARIAHQDTRSSA